MTSFSLSYPLSTTPITHSPLSDPLSLLSNPPSAASDPNSPILTAQSPPKHNSSQISTTTELLQHSVRALRLSKKLRDLMSADPEKLDLAKAAQFHSEILSLCDEYDLSGIKIVDSEILWVKESGDRLRNEAMKVLKRGMEGLNQAEVGTGLQVFYNLGELKQTVEQVINKYKGLGARNV